MSANTYYCIKSCATRYYQPCFFSGINPCNNKAIHVLLHVIHGFAVLNVSFPGPSQKVISAPVTCMVANVET